MQKDERIALAAEAYTSLKHIEDNYNISEIILYPIYQAIKVLERETK